MSDDAVLYLVVLALYLSECQIWIARSTLGLVASRRPHLVFVPTMLGHGRGGFLPGKPLPPMHPTFLLESWPLSLAPQGAVFPGPQVLDPAHEPVAPELVEYQDLLPMQVVGGRLHLPGRTLGHAASAQWSAFLFRHLQELARAEHDERAAIIDRLLNARFDSEAMLDRVQQFHRCTRLLPWIGTAMAYHLFAAAPLMVYRYSLVNSWVVLLATLGVIWLLGQVAFYRAHRALYPERRGERWERQVMMLLLPLSVMRMRDFLARPLLALFDPMMVAQQLEADADGIHQAAAKRDLDHPKQWVGVESGDPACQAQQWFRQRQADAWARWRSAQGVELPESPVLPDNEQSLAYCPRCLDQFADDEAICESCGLAVEAFA